MRQIRGVCGTTHFLLAEFTAPWTGGGRHLARIGNEVSFHISAMAGRESDPGVMLARIWTETMQMLEPISIDRWPHELSLKYGMRDALTCSVARRRLVSYLVASTAEQQTDATGPLLFATASLAALRLEQLIEHDPRCMRKATRVTARELAVRRLVSVGMQTEEIAGVARLRGRDGSLAPQEGGRTNSGFATERRPPARPSDET